MEFLVIIGMAGLVFIPVIGWKLATREKCPRIAADQEIDRYMPVEDSRIQSETYCTARRGVYQQLLTMFETDFWIVIRITVSLWLLVLGTVLTCLLENGVPLAVPLGGLCVLILLRGVLVPIIDAMARVVARPVERSETFAGYSVQLTVDPHEPRFLREYLPTGPPLVMCQTKSTHWTAAAWSWIVWLFVSLIMRAGFNYGFMVLRTRDGIVTQSEVRIRYKRLPIRMSELYWMTGDKSLAGADIHLRRDLAVAMQEPGCVVPGGGLENPHAVMRLIREHSDGI